MSESEKAVHLIPTWKHVTEIPSASEVEESDDKINRQEAV
jgi:hypothetical protein